MKYSPHLTRFFISLPPNELAPLLVEALNTLDVKHKVKPPAIVLVGGYDARKEKFKGRVTFEAFEWRGGKCSIVEMVREEVRRMFSEGGYRANAYSFPKGNPISWRQFWKATVKTPQMEPHVLRKR
jgi:serine/threonine-protein kinase CHEK1